MQGLKFKLWHEGENIPSKKATTPTIGVFLTQLPKFLGKLEIGPIPSTEGHIFNCNLYAMKARKEYK